VADSQRLQQLRQQRDLVAGHLAWLDAEIAAAAGTPDVMPGPKLKMAPRPASPTPVQLEAANPSPALTADPDAVLGQWTDETPAPAVSKSGCWIIFSLATLLLLGGTVWAIYAHYR